MKTPTLQQLRVIVFVVWVSFAVVLTLMPFGFLLTKHYHRDVSGDLMRSLSFTLTSLWLPALGCFAGYWFGAGKTVAEPSGQPGAKLAALLLTVFPLGLIIVMVGTTLFLHEFGRDEENNPLNRPLEDEVERLVGMLRLISTLSYAPITFLTGQAIREAVQKNDQE